ncbi:LacI family DNA-binding transcriptional regulator [Paenibacillus xerothermodurans]|uniref:LacI family transcriptional regulator n=1 Tax=Paenibacillus xerothermodurans TaxID=1977292 RepID=A0A2W1NA74_PAEXE|nr:LacI family DNA-binding transcriptional regulator [Paenibacillus xerothermodurans]PZE20071.1 LacI family transcriptional regulator [Paenibacillus xerothermodurans]
MRQVTMGDVAKKCKLSVATVSRVYTDPEKVSPKNREKVYKAIQELNYQPNALARNLRKLQTNSILVIIPNIMNTFFSYILCAIQKVAFNSGYKVLLGDTDSSPEMEAKYLYYLQQKLVDGVILLYPRSNPEEIQKIAGEYPVVIVGQQAPESSIPFVINSNFLSSQTATEHMIKLGHRRIAHFSGRLSQPVSRERQKGFVFAMEANGLDVDKSLVCEGDFYFDSGHALALKLLSSAQPPSALVAASDEMAIGAIKAARKLGVRVPEDFAIIGFDDIKMASICEPALTTMAQPKEELARLSTEMLLSYIKGEPPHQNCVVLNDQLIIRESCGWALLNND